MRFLWCTSDAAAACVWHHAAAWAINGGSSCTTHCQLCIIVYGIMQLYLQDRILCYAICITISQHHNY